MPNFRGSPSLVRSGTPKNGQERIVSDRDGVTHLEYFMNGSWRHNRDRCKGRVNKDCKRD